MVLFGWIVVGGKLVRLELCYWLDRFGVSLMFRLGQT